MEGGGSPRANALQKAEGRVKDLEEELLIPGDLFSGGFERVLALVLAQEVEADAAPEGEVVRSVFLSCSASVFSKDNIQNPVRLVFDLPVAADGVRQ